jgi:hypothetical protein
MTEPIPKLKETQAIKVALQGVLDSNLLRSPSIEEFIASLPGDEELLTISETRQDDLLSDALSLIGASVEYLQGMLSGIALDDELHTRIIEVRNALLQAALAVESRPAVKAEYEALLASSRGTQSESR